jgi:thiol:disulfide interchange protein
MRRAIIRRRHALVDRLILSQQYMAPGALVEFKEMPDNNILEISCRRKSKMKRTISACMLLVLSSLVFSQMSASRPGATATQSKLFNPDRDAAKDIEAAVAEAARTGKRVLVDVGGDWCIWCRTMERYVDEHADLRALRDKNYVTVKVNWSPENKNEAVLSKYPKIPGYPHLFVLEKNGSLLHSQDTSQLEDGHTSYDLEKYTAFLTKWSPARK